MLTPGHGVDLLLSVGQLVAVSGKNQILFKAVITKRNADSKSVVILC